MDELTGIAQRPGTISSDQQKTEFNTKVQNLNHRIQQAGLYFTQVRNVFAHLRQNNAQPRSMAAIPNYPLSTISFVNATEEAIKTACERMTAAIATLKPEMEYISDKADVAYAALLSAYPHSQQTTKKSVRRAAPRK